MAALRRAASRFRKDDMTDWAAALTYYSLLSLFPALIAMVSLIGLVGNPASTTSALTEVVASIGPRSAAQTFAGPIRSIASNQSAAGFAFVLGLAAALWSASGYVGAFMRASNVIYETREERPFWKRRPLQANFGSYDKTYGTLAGLVVLLVWLWIGNVAILFGHGLNAECARG
ncbi:MAG TPA: YihY/virulence factor BrkB family protein [Solirubrobacterales bacterium]